MKTLVQRDHWSCGSVALYNALVLLGMKPPSLKKLIKMCKTTNTKHPEGPGTSFRDMFKVARKLGIKVRRVYRRDSKGVFILNHRSGPGKKHLIATKDKIIYNGWSGKRYVPKSLTLRVKCIKCYKLVIKEKK